VIAATLRQSGIDMDYAYGVLTGYHDSLYLAEPAVYAPQLRSSDLKARLFPQDVFAPPAYLSLHFPERRTYVWAQILPLVGAEVVFMLIIIACFGYTIRTILKQRRFSRLLVDFINNMTHEFKTPISTVALATEAIGRPDILAQKDRVLQFNAMIRTEIGRMRNQTEKILQMATLEEGDIQLSLAEVDLHDLIRETVEAVSLQAETLGGAVTTELGARDPVVRGDRLHLANIIHNLLDNAMKYSSDGPRISVQTHDDARGVEVHIRDHGIGMRADEQKQAFHKYYRVSTGDRHDVKGFGLGLSYVKLMVEAHGGTVTLESTPGQGTDVGFTIPRPPQRTPGS
jgi:two-component system phosphate regulon sensor histidine kinase PhoR